MHIFGLTIIMLVFCALLASSTVVAMPPENGVYPTTERQWKSCCNDNDCMALDVEVHGGVGPEWRRVITPLGSFVVPTHRVHTITQPGAAEHICTSRGDVPQPNGGNVICVFFNVGYQ
jgi:hypothetical protein